MNKKLKIVVGLVAVLAAGVAIAATQVSADQIRCAMKGPFYGRSDGICHDASTYAPMLITNGQLDQGLSSVYMVNVREEFIGMNTGIQDIDSPAGIGPWATQDQNTAGCPASKDDYDNGALELLLDNGNEAGDCTLYFGDNQVIDSDMNPVCIFRLAVQTQPAAADTLSWGLINGRNALFESTNSNAAFVIAGANLTLNVTSDDSSADTGLDTTGVTLVAGTMYEFMVSMSPNLGISADDSNGDLDTDVGFYYRTTVGGEWTKLNNTTAYSIGNDKALQPFVQVEKTAGTTTPDLLVDYVNCYWTK